MSMIGHRAERKKDRKGKERAEEYHPNASSAKDRRTGNSVAPGTKVGQDAKPIEANNVGHKLLRKMGTYSSRC